jgi:hypothetical protein
MQESGGGAIINFARAGLPQANMVADNCAKQESRLSHARWRWKEEIRESVSMPWPPALSILHRTLPR